MIYNDEHATVEESLTDSNVGARKGRNIRDNLFVINAITNSGKQPVKKVLVQKTVKAREKSDKKILAKPPPKVVGQDPADSYLSMIPVFSK